MKQFNLMKNPTARKRLVSGILAVATIVTALVVIPITFTTKMEAAAGGSAAGAFAQDGNHLDYSHVFYAPQWKGYIDEYGNDENKHLFKTYKHTDKSHGENENFYHDGSSSFVFRADGSGVDPFVHFHVTSAGVNLSADEYKYITITYGVYNGSKASNKVQDLTMTIYPLIVQPQGGETMNNASESKPLTVQLEAPVNPEADANRIFHTAVFDLSDFQSDKTDSNGNPFKWAGQILGFRFDYFQENAANDFSGMVMFVDSIGFFKTMDETEYHMRERDWVRNGPVRGYADNYNDRNIFTAVSRSLGGYLHSPFGMESPSYFVWDRTYLIKKPNTLGDTGIFFSMDGSGGTNQYDRSLPTKYKYMAISIKSQILTESAQPETVSVGTMQVFMYTARGGGILSEGMSVKVDTAEIYDKIYTDRYYTFVFDLSNIVKNVDKIYGFRLDLTNQMQQMQFCIDSIGFFETKGEAEAMGRAPAYLVRGSTLYGDLDNMHNMNVRQSTNEESLVFECKANCSDRGHTESATAPVGSEGQKNACGHLKYEYNQVLKTEQKTVVDPSVKLLFQDYGFVPTKDYRYLVITYKLPSSSKNVFEKLCPGHNCKKCDPNNQSTGSACFNDIADGPALHDGAVPLAFHPTVGWLNDDWSISQYEYSNFRIWQKLTPDGYDTWITCALELTDQILSQNELFGSLRGIRVDLFDAHIASVDSYIYINEIKLVSTKAEAYEGVVDKNSDTYQIKVSTENNVDSASGYKTVVPVHSAHTWDSKGDTKPFTLTLTAAMQTDMALLRDHYDFVGWKAFYVNSSGERVEVSITTDGKFDIPISESMYTKLEERTEYQQDKVLHLSDYTLDVIMVAQWRLSTGLLTIKLPSSATDAECLYRITGTATDSAAYTFTPLIVSGVSDGLKNGSVTVSLPDGIYYVEMLSDWGWRYVGASGLMSGEITVYGAGAITTDAAGNSSKGNGKNGTHSFASVNMMNPYLINGYGYGRAIP